ncbi:carbohydrate kinase family protein [Pseudactinotalea sp.]|uniref:carbohydrate kinase family protein n=1 Tax=Pseudactinotalea sp. TaxID=1926260 RepID=UPI003B3AB3F6
MTPEPELDLLLAGTVFFDLVFTGFPHQPQPGTEVWTEGMGSSPGGIANLAVAAARLGLRTAVASGFGDDLYADWLWSTLRDQERIDLSYSQRHHGAHTPVTVALSYDDDRAFVTHGHPWPVSTGEMLADPPRTRAVLVDLGDETVRAERWWRQAAADGALVFATAGWDPEQQWDPRILDELAGCHAFFPNAVEAMGYTRTDSVEAALSALSEHVPLAIVTQGRSGVSAIDRTTGERESVPAIPVAAIDTTGAGDVFAAAVVLGTLKGWPLRKRLAFAALCSALTVTQVGGSLAAPGWGDVADWWREQQAAADGGGSSQEIVDRYAFLTECLRGVETPKVRRAEATIARFSDAG